MARDYKHAEVFSPGTRPLPLWLWLFAVLAVSGFVGLIYYLDQYEKTKGTDALGSAENKNQVQQNTGEKPAMDSKPRFDFYKLLPKISVDVPKTETTLRQSEPESSTEPATNPNTTVNTAPSTTAPATPATAFVLQAGSFREFHEADRLKASLALMGIHANIEKVTLNSNETWHRVRIGPFQSEREMNKVRGQLRNQNIEPVLLKVKS